jgi:tetratricopeptide (TPR) repeat protein
VQRARGNALLGLGDPTAALRAYAASAAACDVAEDAFEHSVALFNMGEASADTGDNDRALYYFQLALEAKGRVGDVWGLAYTHQALARLHLTVDEPKLALEEARRALSLGERTNDSKLRSILHRTVAEALTSLGAIPDARDHLAQAIELANAVGAAPEIAAAQSALLRLDGGRG